MADDDDNNVFKHFRAKLVSRLTGTAVSQLCDRLIDGVISTEEYNLITNSFFHLTEEQQVRALLDIMQKRGNEQKTKFLSMLCETNGVEDLGREIQKWQCKIRSLACLFFSLNIKGIPRMLCDD